MPEDNSVSEIDLDRSSGSTSLGVHLFQITGWKSKTLNDNPTWIFDLVCIDPASEDKGIKTSTFLTMTQEARWKVDEFLDAVGAPRKGKASGQSFIGKTFRGNVEDSEYNHKVTRKITQYLPPTGDLPKSLSKSTGSTESTQSQLPVTDFPVNKTPF